MSGIRTVVQQVQDDIADILKDAGEDGQEIKLMAARVGELALEAATMKLTGSNTEVAERALLAATKNLAAATSLTVAESVLQVVERLGHRIISGVIAGAFATV